MAITKEDVDKFLTGPMTSEVRHYLLHKCLDRTFAWFIEEHPQITGFLSQPISSLITWSSRKFRVEQSEDGGSLANGRRAEHDREHGRV